MLIGAFQPLALLRGGEAEAGGELSLSGKRHRACGKDLSGDLIKCAYLTALICKTRQMKSGHIMMQFWGAHYRPRCFQQFM